MVRDLSNEGIAKFIRELESQHGLLIKGLITYPKEELIEKGYEYYSQLDEEKQEKFDALKRAHIKRKKSRRMYSTTTK